jgi:hypothetical protein
MSDGYEDAKMRTAQESDSGEPIPALAELEHHASSDLLSRIRHSIQRRTALGQLSSFSVDIPMLVLKEFWSILIDCLNSKDARKDRRFGKKTS